MKRKESPTASISDTSSVHRKQAKMTHENALDAMHPIDLKRMIEMYSKALQKQMLKLISNLPNEIVLIILGFLSPLERISSGPLYCCKHWYECIRNTEDLWKSVWKMLFSTDDMSYDPSNSSSKFYLQRRVDLFLKQGETRYWNYSFDNCNASMPCQSEIISDHRSKKSTSFTSEFYLLTKRPQAICICCEEGCGSGYGGNTLLMIDHLEGVYFPPNKTTFFMFTLKSEYKDVEYESCEYFQSFNVTLLASLPWSLEGPITLISNNKILHPRVKQLARDYLQLSTDELLINSLHNQSCESPLMERMSHEVRWFQQWLQNFEFFGGSVVERTMKVVENDQLVESDEDDDEGKSVVVENSEYENDEE
nr:unnamed protein product [Naegleria fowleri]